MYGAIFHICNVRLANSRHQTRDIVNICKNIKDFGRNFSARRKNAYIRIAHLSFMKKVFLLMILAPLLQGCKSTPTATSRVITPIGRWYVYGDSSSANYYGVELLKDGRARSINLISRHYEQWTQRGDTLVLSGHSLIDETEQTFSDTMRILAMTRTQMVLEGADFRCTMNRISE